MVEMMQINQGPDYPLSLQVYDLQNLDSGSETDTHHQRVRETLEGKVNEIQASIDLEKGPLMKLGLFRLPDGDRLLIVIHHLVIDTVSWRILFEDIQNLYQQYKRGEPLQLPPKTDSFKLWSEKLCQYANSEAFLKEKPYWSKLASMEVPPIEKDFQVEDNYVKDTQRLSFHLSEEETNNLLLKVNDYLGTEINDILLGALGLAIKESFNRDQLLISLESHGREEVIKDMDISRTVGWFTSKYPVVFDLSTSDDLSRQIKEVKETLRQVPNKGIGYWILKYLTSPEHKENLHFKLNPQINFNYLGQFDSDVSKTSFGIAAESCGTLSSPERQRSHELEVSGMIANKQLVMSIAYSNKQYKRETIESLLNDYKTSLCRVVSHCLAQKEKELTPNDLTYNQLSINDLELIQTMMDKI